MVKDVSKKRFYFLVWFVFIVTLIIFGFVIYSHLNKTLEEKELYGFLKVVNNSAGLMVNGTALAFGELPWGVSSYKKVKLKNDYSFPILVNLEISGNISEFLVFEKQIFLEVDEQKNITISTIKIPENTSFGTYEGIMKFVFKRNF